MIDGHTIAALTVALFGLTLSVTSAVAKRSELRTNETVASAALGRDINTSLYLPQDYNTADGASRRYPVIYLLHGLGDDHMAWPKYGQIKATLDRMIRRKELQPVVVVMPDADKSWYINDQREDGYGRMADALRVDLVRAIDTRYRTAACREGRAIGGLSMGGYGALLYGVSRPDLYTAVFSLSGAVFQENLADDLERRKRLAGLFGGVFGVPFDEARFAQWNIFGRLNALKPNVTYPSVWLSAGDDDFPSIVRGSVRVFQLLQTRGIPAELRIDDAPHVWSYWRKSIVPALRWLSPRLAADCANVDGQPVTPKTNRLPGR
ncbi:MAG: alpha/beta hydrolase-fold protein [Pseudomonadota bacterium]